MLIAAIRSLLIFSYFPFVNLIFFVQSQTPTILKSKYAFAFAFSITECAFAFAECSITECAFAECSIGECAFAECSITPIKYAFVVRAFLETNSVLFLDVLFKMISYV